LKDKHKEFAKRSMVVAASFGLASALSVVVLGDESGYTATQHQKMKIAAVEAIWETEPAPASLVLFGIPDQKTETTAYEIKVPWLLGLIATRSFDGVVPGIKELRAEAEETIKRGILAYGALQDLKKDRSNQKARDIFEANKKALGHGLLLKKYTPSVVDATEEQIKQAASDTVPNVPLLFWSFRVMVGLGFFFIAFFSYAFYLASKRRLETQPWFLKLCVISLPLPWIAIEAGWFVAEHGRQPWTVDGVLPTFLSGSTLPYGTVLATLIAFVLFYSILAVVDVLLMIKYVKLGPVAAQTKGE
jgi:cytochrome d ubiquinol oxidase subunit I